jgi:hypothetical protein
MANTRWRFVDCDADHIAGFQFSQIITVPIAIHDRMLYPQCHSGTANATDSKCVGCDATDQEFARWSHKPMMRKRPWTLTPKPFFYNPVMLITSIFADWRRSDPFPKGRAQ